MNMASIYLPLANHTKEQEAAGHTFNSKYVSLISPVSTRYILSLQTLRHTVSSLFANTNFSVQILPGPPVYQGKHAAPSGSPSTITETGAMTGELKAKYDKVIRQLDETGRKTIVYINGNANQNAKLDPTKGQGFFADLAAMGKENDKILAGPDMADLKATVETAF
jgi:hypothetical protein